MEFILKLSADISKSLSFLFILLYPFKAKMLQFVLERWGGVNNGKGRYRRWTNSRRTYSTKMPQLRIVTNVPKDAIPENFLMEATTIFQAAINKPMKV